MLRSNAAFGVQLVFGRCICMRTHPNLFVMGYKLVQGSVAEVWRIACCA